MDTLARLADGVLSGDAPRVEELTRQAIAEGVAPKQILDTGLLASMATVGEQFKAHEIFLPEVLLAARAMKAGMNLLKPLLVDQGVPTMGKVVLGTVKDDQHDIGKNLVGIMLQSAGFEVIDLGYDVAPAAFLEAATEHQAAVIGMSALLIQTRASMKAVVDLVKQRGLAEKIRTIVGGAPVDQAFADQIGADAYGFDAASAVDRVRGLMGES